MTRAKANLLLLFAAAAWGGAFYFQKMAMDHIGPILMTGFRALLAAACLMPLVWLESRRGGRPWTPALTRYAPLAGILFACAGMIHQAGMATATVTNGGFLTSLYMIVTPLLTLLILRRTPPIHVWPALALALAGTWFLTGASPAGFSEGDILIIVSTLFWGGMMMVTALAAGEGRPLAFTAIELATAAAVALPVALMVEPFEPAAIRAAIPDILYLGCVAGAFTFSLFAVASRYTTSGEAVILLATETLFAAASGAILLGERLSPAGWLGAALMLAATLLVQLGPSLGRRRPATG